MRAVDTNVLVRLVTRDHPRQVAAAEAYVSRGAWVPQVVLVEAVWVLTSVYQLAPGSIAVEVLPHALGNAPARYVFLPPLP